MVDEQSKAKKMWDNFQSGSHSQQAPEEHIPWPATQRDLSTSNQTLHELDDMALQAEMGLPLPEPYYCAPTFSFGLQNLATAFWEATKSKILTNSEKDPNSLLLIGQGKASEDHAVPITDQIKTKSEEGDPNPTNSTLATKLIHEEYKPQEKEEIRKKV